jgi:hypothetical protein
MSSNKEKSKTEYEGGRLGERLQLTDVTQNSEKGHLTA